MITKDIYRSTRSEPMVISVRQAFHEKHDKNKRKRDQYGLWNLLSNIHNVVEIWKR